jgi:hypothetical protein
LLRSYTFTLYICIKGDFSLVFQYVLFIYTPGKSSICSYRWWWSTWRLICQSIEPWKTIRNVASLYKTRLLQRETFNVKGFPTPLSLPLYSLSLSLSLSFFLSLSNSRFLYNSITEWTLVFFRWKRFVSAVTTAEEDLIKLDWRTTTHIHTHTSYAIHI